MNNDEALSAFAEFLDVPPSDVRARLISGVMGESLSRERLLDCVREFAMAIDPVPLAEATVKEMHIFVSDIRRTHTNQVPRECERYRRYFAMEIFRCFRDSVLKRNSKRAKNVRRPKVI